MYYAVSVSDFWRKDFRYKRKRDVFHSQMKSLGYTDSVILNSRAWDGDANAIDARLCQEILDKALGDGEYILFHGHGQKA